MTVDDIFRILVEEAGAPEETPADADVLDVPFAELGYDSLALMALAGRIKHEHGVTIPDEHIIELDTPRALLEAVEGTVPSPT